MNSKIEICKTIPLFVSLIICVSFDRQKLYLILRSPLTSRNSGLCLYLRQADFRMILLFELNEHFPSVMFCQRQLLWFSQLCGHHTPNIDSILPAVYHHLVYRKGFLQRTFWAANKLIIRQFTMTVKKSLLTKLNSLQFMNKNND